MLSDTDGDGSVDVAVRFRDATEQRRPIGRREVESALAGGSNNSSSEARLHRNRIARQGSSARKFVGRVIGAR